MDVRGQYFPDVLQNRGGPYPDPLWVLMDRRGNILTTGRAHDSAPPFASFAQSEIEALYPGIVTGPTVVSAVATTIPGARLAWATVSFVWLAPDSPITDPAEADTTRRADVLILANVMHANRRAGNIPLAAKFAAPCTKSLRFVRLQVTATEVDANTVDLQLRVQPLADPGPASAADDWLPESPTVRAAYGQDAVVQLNDANQTPWRVALNAQRLEAPIR